LFTYKAGTLGCEPSRHDGQCAHLLHGHSPRVRSRRRRAEANLRHRRGTTPAGFRAGRLCVANDGTQYSSLGRPPNAEVLPFVGLEPPVKPNKKAPRVRSFAHRGHHSRRATSPSGAGGRHDYRACHRHQGMSREKFHRDADLPIPGNPELFGCMNLGFADAATEGRVPEAVGTRDCRHRSSCAPFAFPSASRFFFVRSDSAVTRVEAATKLWCGRCSTTGTRHSNGGHSASQA
jgi:hypothetical protein